MGAPLPHPAPLLPPTSTHAATLRGMCGRRDGDSCRLGGIYKENTVWRKSYPKCTRVRLGTTKTLVVPRQSHLSATHRDTGNPKRCRLRVRAARTAHCQCDVNTQRAQFCASLRHALRASTRRPGGNGRAEGGARGAGLAADTRSTSQAFFPVFLTCACACACACGVGDRSGVRAWAPRSSLRACSCSRSPKMCSRRCTCEERDYKG